MVLQIYNFTHVLMVIVHTLISSITRTKSQYGQLEIEKKMLWDWDWIMLNSCDIEKSGDDEEDIR